ncbi:MAG: ankyrin repeat domain-containing protein [Candidatus Dependentiae bacterium]|nr:ankyrin repeat domain-containing protein [Candidatus Dependentiae bacterium]
MKKNILFPLLIATLLAPVNIRPVDTKPDPYLLGKVLGLVTIPALIYDYATRGAGVCSTCKPTINRVSSAVGASGLIGGMYLIKHGYNTKNYGIGSLGAGLVSLRLALKYFSRNDNNKALKEAASRGHDDCIKTLLHRKADINDRDEHGWTPLIHAARYNREDAVKVLLEEKATVDLQDDSGRTALMHAASHQIGDSIQILELLLKAKAHVNEQRSLRWTALHYACNRYPGDKNKDPLEVKTLLNAGARLDLTNDDGDAAENIAQKNNDVKILQAIQVYKNYAGNFLVKNVPMTCLKHTNIPKDPINIITDYVVGPKDNRTIDDEGLKSYGLSREHEFLRQIKTQGGDVQPSYSRSLFNVGATVAVAAVGVGGLLLKFLSAKKAH